MPISTNGYYEPTPAKIRKVADTVAASLKVIGASKVVSASPMAGLIVMALGELATIVSNFWVD